MPNAVLAAVVFLIGLKLVDFRGMADDRARPAGRVRRRARHRRDRRGRRRGAGDHPGDGALDRRAHLPQLSPVRHAPGADAGWHPGPRRAGSARRGRPRSGDLPLRGEPVLRERAAASPRRSWTSSKVPTRRSAGSASPARRSATSTTRGPTRFARSRRSSPARTWTFVICDLEPEGPRTARRVRPDRNDRGRPHLRHASATCSRPTAPREGRTLPGRRMPGPSTARATPPDAGPPPGKAERGRIPGCLARRPPAGRRRSQGARPAGGPRRLAAGARPPGSGRAPGGAGHDPGAGPRPDPLRPDGRCRRSRSTAARPCRWPRTWRRRRPAGIRVQLCGDAHLLNFGLFASPERNLVFDINDFDETLHGPVRVGRQAPRRQPRRRGPVRGFAAHATRHAVHRAVRLVPRADGRLRGDARHRRLLRARRRGRDPRLRRQAGAPVPRAGGPGRRTITTRSTSSRSSPRSTRRGVAGSWTTRPIITHLPEVTPDLVIAAR